MISHAGLVFLTISPTILSTSALDPLIAHLTSLCMPLSLKSTLVNLSPASLISLSTLLVVNQRQFLALREERAESERREVRI
jgi:hypothetical protein